MRWLEKDRRYLSATSYKIYSIKMIITKITIINSDAIKKDV